MAIHLIGRAWSCMHPVLREVNMTMADASVSLTPYVLGFVIDAMLEAGFGADFPIFYNQWIEGMNIQEDSIVIGDDEFIIYRANRAWMTQLYQDKISGFVSLSDPFPCERYNFIAGVDPIEYP